MRSLYTLILVLASVACGGEDHAVPTGAVGGTGTPGGSGTLGGTGTLGGGGSATSGASGAVSVDSGGAPNTAYAACVAYDTATCQRRLECGLIGGPCPDPSTSKDCPDKFFSDGSQRTVDGLLACAAEWSTFPCDQVLTGMVPSCVVGGTRAPGASCLYGSQCQSLFCGGPAPDANHTDCSTCKRTYGPNEDCSVNAPDATCPVGQVCNATQRCGPHGPTPFDPEPSANEMCIFGCRDNLYCLASTVGATTGTCGTLPASGATCMYETYNATATCESGLVCGQDKICAALPGLGATCMFDIDKVGRCVAGTYCNGQFQCATPPVAGQPCGNDQNQHDLACAAGTYCKNPSGPSVCTALPTAGQPCVAVFFANESLVEMTSQPEDARCTDGATCDCVDSLCSAGTCVATLAEGAPCGQPNARCSVGICKDGKCQTGTGDVFATLCGG